MFVAQFAGRLGERLDVLWQSLADRTLAFEFRVDLQAQQERGTGSCGEPSVRDD
jgi:hypothetical protein